MKMEDLLPEQARSFLESAAYLEQELDQGEQAVHFGIDELGREFNLIASVVGDVFKLGFL